MKTVKKHFVTFLSPGTLFAETTEKPISKWDIKIAMKMAHTIKERYGATPYSFFFTTRARGPKDLDSKQVKRSCNYFLGGKIETREEIEGRDDPEESILRTNMRVNDIKRVLVNRNSYRATLQIEDKDVVLDWKPKKVVA